MITEKAFEDILSKYPSLIEDGLILKGRQLTLYGRRIDLLFEDRLKRRLIVELKIGPIKDEHIGQILSYEGMLLSADDPTIRVMLLGNRVPPNIQKTLDHHGIAWKEISFVALRDFLKEINDSEFLSLFNNLNSELSNTLIPTKKANIPRSIYTKPRSKYYEIACKKKNDERTHTFRTRAFRINELLNQGKIQEGRIDF
ncbi:MAG: hypothetical protein AABY26_00750, partial [Nanoarchaeota archaeon]